MTRRGLATFRMPKRKMSRSRPSTAGVAAAAKIAPNERTTVGLPGKLGAPDDIDAIIDQRAADDDEEETIRKRAYEIWNSEGRPPPLALEHWLRARSERPKNLSRR